MPKRGYKQSEEHKRKGALARRNKHHSKEWNENISKARLGQSSWNKDKPLSEKHRLSIKEALEGKHYSEERCQNIAKALSGENNNFWKGGVTPEDDLLRVRRDSRHWAEGVKKRDNYTCQRCGKINLIGIDCHAHHIKSWREYKELRYILDNGTTLCKSCHSKTHYKENLKSIFGES